MFTTEFEAEVEESESATLHQYYREAMIQGYNFAFEVTETVYFLKGTSDIILCLLRFLSVRACDITVT